jgi:hypothetical protein
VGRSGLARGVGRRKILVPAPGPLKILRMRVLSFIAIVFVVACSTKTRKHEIDCWPTPVCPAVAADDFDWQRQGPMDLLDRLRQSLDVAYVVAASHRGWLRPSDKPSLEALLESGEACSPVLSYWSSYDRTCRSTIGKEAAYMLKSLEVGVYPSADSSIRCE